MKVWKAIGLKTATKQEIANLKAKYRKLGHPVKHVTEKHYGEPLPFNGVLYVYIK